jgi:hypothetical protein
MRPNAALQVHNQMSDMLQLVVEIIYTLAGYYPLPRILSVANLNDKLKHVGHL